MECIIIGFPKSGNTWLCKMLTEYQNKKCEKLHSFKIKKKPADGSRVYYIVRDPRDQLVSSFFHHYRSYQNQKISFLLKIIINSYILISYRDWNWRNPIKINKTRVSYVGSWKSHFDYYTKVEKYKYVKYEDLVSEPNKTFTRILKDMKIQISDELIKKTLLENSFSNLKKTQDNPEKSFFRKGVIGDHKNYLFKSVEKLILKYNKKQMKELKYIQ